MERSIGFLLVAMLLMQRVSSFQIIAGAFNKQQVIGTTGVKSILFSIEQKQRYRHRLSAIWYEGDETKRETFSTSSSSSKDSKIDSSITNNLSSSRSASSLTSKISYNTRNQQKDVVIVGGALAGLSAALYLSQIDPTRQITIYDSGDSGVASMAAAGMLAPSSERLPKGQLLDLCYASKNMYPDFVEMVESMAKDSGTDGEQYLKSNNYDTTSSKLDPWSVGYVASGGFLAPAFAGDSVATWAPPNDEETTTNAVWLDAMQVRELEPNLHPDVVGGWWFPEDSSVDARRLTCSLRAACVGAGNIQLITNCEVTSLDLSNGVCRGLWINNGKYVKANTVLVANGAWMRNLLPVPIAPHKGQSLSLRMPANTPPLLKRVLFAQDCYIVPKADGRIVIGATVEAGSFDPSVTPAGLMHILHHALQLVPGLATLPLEETWAGLRPTTPDKGPILGKTSWENLYLAGGYWRNGVLLAPKTGYLLAMSMSNNENLLSSKDRELLEAFAWDRFTKPEKSAQLTASSRYAASMYPVHTRSSSGVSASVGTELGSYSTARSAREERAKDRNSLWNSATPDGTEDDAFERAAVLGKKDGSAYSFGGDDADTTYKVNGDHAAQDEIPTSYFEGTADALTVGSSTTSNDLGIQNDDNDEQTTTVSSSTTDIRSAYEIIKANKAKAGAPIMEETSAIDDRPDPGFRIYYVDPDTEEKREVPPYTSPGEFVLKMEREKQQQKASTQSVEATTFTSNSGTSGKDISREENQPVKLRPSSTTTTATTTTTGSSQSTSSSSSYDETTYDGYQVIQQANARSSRTDELQAMRDARRKNRLGQDQIDVDRIGVRDFTSSSSS